VRDHHTLLSPPGRVQTGSAIIPADPGLYNGVKLQKQLQSVKDRDEVGVGRDGA
jgi:hypothetical protein